VIGGGVRKAGADGQRPRDDAPVQGLERRIIGALLLEREVAGGGAKDNEALGGTALRRPGGRPFPIDRRDGDGSRAENETAKQEQDRERPVPCLLQRLVGHLALPARFDPAPDMGCLRRSATAP
jgi:hypothetical protein